MLDGEIGGIGSKSSRGRNRGRRLGNGVLSRVSVRFGRGGRLLSINFHFHGEIEVGIGGLGEYLGCCSSENEFTEGE
jgi:hypothetical protein